MDESHEVRRSGRRRVRPVEFWNFVKPEDTTCESITYNEIELTKCSVFQPFSLSYYKGSPLDYTGDAGRVKLPKKTASVARGSKKSSKKSEISKTPKKTIDNSALSDINSARSPGQRGHKRKLDYSETAEAHPVVNGEDHSQSLKTRGRKSISGQKPPGKSKTQSLLHERDSLCSPIVSKKKQKLEERQEGGKRSPRKPADSSPKTQRRRSVRGLSKQKAGETTNTNNNNNNKKGDVSATPSQNHSNTRGSFFNDSDRQNSRSTQNFTALEQPSFRNVLSSTVIEGPGKAVFKVPRLPSKRCMVPLMKVSSHCIDPSMVTIPEEKEEEEEMDQQHEKLREEGHKQMDVEKEPQSQDRVAGEGDATATATASPRKRARSERSPTAGVTAASTGCQQGKDRQEQVDTTQGTGNIRRSSRVRTRPLEFWNFEKVEVKRQEDGEMQVIHHKQDSASLIQTRVIDCSTILGSQTARGITLSEDLLRMEESTVTSNKPRKSPKRSSKDRNPFAIHPALSPKQMKKVNVDRFFSACSPNSTRKSPSKRRLFSPNLNYFDEPAKEESKMSKISVGGMNLTVVGKIKFGDLKFIVLEKKEYRCYVAQGLHNKEKTVFISYLFLERGNIVWHCAGRMTIYVIAGRGTMQVMNNDEMVKHQLKEKECVKCPKKSKISVKKDGRAAMLKLHVCLVRDAAEPESC